MKENEDVIKSSMIEYKPTSATCTFEEALASAYITNLDEAVAMLRERAISAIMEGKEHNCSFILASSTPANNGAEESNSRVMGLTVIGDMLSIYKLADSTLKQIFEKSPQLKSIHESKERLKKLAPIMGISPDAIDDIITSVMSRQSKAESFEDFFESMIGESSRDSKRDFVEKMFDSRESNSDIAKKAFDRMPKTESEAYQPDGRNIAEDSDTTNVPTPSPTQQGGNIK